MTATVAAVATGHPPVPRTAPGDAGDTWAWVDAVLWGDGDRHVRPARPGEPARWYATTAPDGPRFLAPAAPAAAMRAALRRHHDGFGARERVVRVAAGLVTPLAPGRLLRPVAVDGPPSPLLDAVAAALGVRDPRFALTLGPPRGNRKVVVQVLGPDGRVAGYAKVAHDALTRGLVAAELEHLRRLGGGAGRLRTPIVRGSLDRDGRLVALLGPVPSAAVGRRRTDGLTDLAAQVHDALGTSGRRPLGATAWDLAVRSTLDPTGDGTAPALALLDRWADRPVDAGLAHGDLAPWNVLRSRRGVGLIDWEYAIDGTPEGLDVLRGETQTALHLLGAGPAAALARSRRRAATLAATGRAGGLAAGDLFRLHLVDTLRRAADPSSGPADGRLAALAAAELAAGTPNRTTTDHAPEPRP